MATFSLCRLVRAIDESNPTTKRFDAVAPTDSRVSGYRNLGPLIYSNRAHEPSPWRSQAELV